MQHDPTRKWQLSLLTLPLIVILTIVLPPARAAGDPMGGIRVLDLSTAGRIALRSNPAFAAAAARVRQAKERIAQARSSYLPRLDFTASSAHVTMPEKTYRANLAAARSLDPSARIDDPQDYFNAGVTASWILFNGFERRLTHLAALHGEEQTEFARMDVKRLLLSGVSTAYFNAQLALENLAIAEADEAFNQRQLLEAKARRRVGTGTLSDELNFEVRVNSAKASVIQAKQAYEIAMFALAALMGLPEAAFPADLRLADLVSETPEEMERPLLEPHVAYAREQRPDILQGAAAVQQAASGVGIARAAFFPTATLVATMDGQRVDSADYEADDFGSTIAVTLSYELFSGGLRRARLREAKQQSVEVEKTLEGLMLSATAQVRSAVTTVASAQSQLQLQRKNANLVKKNRDLVEKEYAAGQGSLVRLNQAQRDLITAQSHLALALVSVRQAWSDLQTETGQILARWIDD